MAIHQEERLPMSRSLERGGDASSGRQRRNYSKKNSRPLVVLWREALANCDQLSTTDKCVGFVLANFMSKEGSARPGKPTLARLASCGLRSVDASIGRLEKLGFLRIERSPGACNRYGALFPTPAGDARVGVNRPTQLTQQPPQLTTVTPAPVAPEIEVEQERTTRREEDDGEESHDSERGSGYTPAALNPRSTANALSNDLRPAPAQGVSGPRRYRRMRATYNGQTVEFSWPAETCEALGREMRRHGASVDLRVAGGQPLYDDKPYASTGQLVAA